MRVDRWFLIFLDRNNGAVVEWEVLMMSTRAQSRGTMGNEAHGATNDVVVVVIVGCSVGGDTGNMTTVRQWRQFVILRNTNLRRGLIRDRGKG